MTDTDSALVELVLRCSAEHEYDLAIACQTFSPLGFRHEPAEENEVADTAEFGLYLEPDKVENTLAAFAAHGVQLKNWSVIPVSSDWANEWKKFHNSIQVGRLWVGPPWQLKDAPQGLHKVIIDPGQGFGTGAHPTTWMVLKLMQKFTSPKRIMDVGCGSGVLAISAAKLGHNKIIALDNDPEAVTDAARQIEINKVSQQITLLSEDILLSTGQPLWTKYGTNVILANLIMLPLLDLADLLDRYPVENVVVSGLLKSQEERVTDRYRTAGYLPVESTHRDGWVAIHFTRFNLEHDGRGTPGLLP